MRRIWRVAWPMLTVACCILCTGAQNAVPPVAPTVEIGPAVTPVPVPAVIAPPATGPKPTIQMAILLDTSGSMSGLITQAKAQLWTIVNEFVLARHNGQAPEVQLALYQYGNDGLPAEGGYIQQILPFTTDLDKVSEKLFALTTNGGSEYCGQVIKRSVEELGWNPATEVMKTIFIAGNEPFTQGPVDFHDSCKTSIAKGIVINTIFCGQKTEGEQTGWKDGAVLAEGAFMSIDMNQRVVDIAAPQDTEITRLNTALNGTYIPYGAQGRVAATNQVAQDMNAAQVGGKIAADRAVTKASANYQNAYWDLVDALKAGTVKLAEVKAEDLPENMQKMTADERKAFVEKQTAERARIQAEIGKLSTARTAFLAEEMKKQAAPGEKTLQDAILEVVHQQAARQGYTFEAPKAP